MAASSNRKTLISDIGEFELIRRYFQTQQASEAGVILGSGDDCAVLEADDHYDQLISTDQLLEGIHFKKSYGSPQDVGHKAAAVNLSDIAAMGGRPTGLFLSLGLPASTPVSWVEGFSKGFHQLSTAFGVPLLGGDTTGSENKIVVGVTVIGRVAKANLKRRSAAKPYDVLCTTGMLGNAAAGLQILQQGNGNLDPQFACFLMKAYRSPDPSTEQGMWLGDVSEVHAMIDLSDGVAIDGQHICKSSELRMKIDVGQLPLSEAFKKFTADNTALRNQFALSGGEDYHLLCTVDPDAYDKISSKFAAKFGKQLHQIGIVREGDAGITFLDGDKEIPPPDSVFNHFK